MVLVILIICNVVAVVAALMSVGFLVWTLTDTWRLRRLAAKMDKQLDKT